MALSICLFTGLHLDLSWAGLYLAYFIFKLYVSLKSMIYFKLLWLAHIILHVYIIENSVTDSTEIVKIVFLPSL